MTDLPNPNPRASLIPIPRSTAMVWVNLATTLIIAAIGFGVGFAQGQKAQNVILATVISIAVMLWLLNYVVVIFETRATDREPTAAAAPQAGRRLRRRVAQPVATIGIGLRALAA